MNRALTISILVATAGSGQSPYGSAPGPVGPTASAPAPQLRNVGVEQKLNAQIPLDLRFRTETGRETTIREFLGKRPAILAPVYYTCPRLCTMTLTGVLKTARSLPLNIGQEYDVIAVSFDPRDTPMKAGAKKLAYVEGYGRAGSAHGWHFLTGSKREIERLTETIGFSFEYDDRTDQYSHASAIIVLTPGGKVSRYFYGIEYPPRDVRLALVEAGQGKIGSLVDQFLLYCFHYDPSTGRYSTAVMNVVRIGGMATLLAVVAFVFVSRTRERRLVRRVS